MTKETLLECETRRRLTSLSNLRQYVSRRLTHCVYSCTELGRAASVTRARTLSPNSVRNAQASTLRTKPVTGVMC